jgi:hypothetical protein
VRLLHEALRRLGVAVLFQTSRESAMGHPVLRFIKRLKVRQPRTSL